MPKSFPAYKFKLANKVVTVNIYNDKIEILGYSGIDEHHRTLPPYDHKTIKVERVNLVQDLRE